MVPTAVATTSSMSKRRIRSLYQRHSGFTLIELLIVLALLVAIAALVWPSLTTPMDNQRLKKSAEIVRAEWGKARVRAMRTGRIHVFRFQDGTGQFRVEPWYANDDFLNSNAQTVQGVVIEGDVDTHVNAKLPGDVVFHGSVTALDTRAMEVEQQIELPAAGVSRPILFYPDGTSSDTTLILGNGTPRFVRIQLRGLTGISSVSDTMKPEQLQALVQPQPQVNTN